MKQLFGWLQNISHKTGLTTAIMAAITFIQSSQALIGALAISWINLACGVVLLIGKAIAPTGTLPKGWTNTLWITNIAALLIQIGGLIGDSGMFAANVVLAVTKIQIVLNAVIAAVQLANTQPTAQLK